MGTELNDIKRTRIDITKRRGKAKVTVDERNALYIKLICALLPIYFSVFVLL